MREECVSGSWAEAAGCAQGEVCAGPETSKPGECLLVASVCENSKGARTCDGAGTLYQCDANGVVQMQTECSSAALCMPGIRTGVCAMCAPGANRCTGATLEACSPTGDVWAPSQTCASDALCDAKAGQCKTSACTPGQKMCTGDDLVECNPQQTAFQKLKTCGRGLCNGSRGDCNTCMPGGAPRCEGTSVVSCSADGSMENRSACSSGYCSAGRCVDCMPGMSRSCGNPAKGICKPGTERCSATGVWGTICEGEQKPESEETRPCDGLDNDCDGMPDDCADTRLTCRTLVGTETKCLPAGSYTDSCTHCEVSGGSIRCACAGNQALGTAIPLTCRDIFQSEGDLMCV